MDMLGFLGVVVYGALVALVHIFIWRKAILLKFYPYRRASALYPLTGMLLVGLALYVVWGHDGLFMEESKAAFALMIFTGLAWLVRMACPNMYRCGDCSKWFWMSQLKACGDTACNGYRCGKCADFHEMENRERRRVS